MKSDIFEFLFFLWSGFLLKSEKGGFWEVRLNCFWKISLSNRKDTAYIGHIVNWFRTFILYLTLSPPILESGPHPGTQKDPSGGGESEGLNVLHPQPSNKSMARNGTRFRDCSIEPYCFGVHWHGLCWYSKLVIIL